MHYLISSFVFCFVIKFSILIFVNFSYVKNALGQFLTKNHGVICYSVCQKDSILYNTSDFFSPISEFVCYMVLSPYKNYFLWVAPILTSKTTSFRYANLYEQHQWFWMVLGQKECFFIMMHTMCIYFQTKNKTVFFILRHQLNAARLLQNQFGEMPLWNYEFFCHRHFFGVIISHYFMTFRYTECFFLKWYITERYKLTFNERLTYRIIFIIYLICCFLIVLRAVWTQLIFKKNRWI